MSGVLLRTPREDYLRVGIVQFFIWHTPHIQTAIATNVELLKEPHILAKVFWLRDHPTKLMKFNNGIIMAATVYDIPSRAQYIPVSRIISRCGVTEHTLQLDYGEDRVIFAIHIRRSLYCLCLSSNGNIRVISCLIINVLVLVICGNSGIVA